MATHSAVGPFLVVVSMILMATTSRAFLNFSDFQNNVQPKAPVAEIGSPSFTFNCTVNRSDLTANGIVWKHYSEELPRGWYNIVSTTLIQLVIPNITESSQGNYECRSRLDDSHIGGERLEVGYPPDQPTFERCLSDNLGSFTCWWNRGRDPILKTTYNLTYTFNVDKKDRTVNECELTSMNGETVAFFCTDTTAADLLHKFVMVAENDLGTVTSDPVILDPGHYVKPRSVRDVVTSNVGADALTVSWQEPDGLESSHFTLFYQVRYWSEWDQSYKEKNASRDKSLELRDLNPYTDYTICVRSHPLEYQTSDKFNGFWSDCAPNYTVKTQEAAPSGQVEAWLLVTRDSRDQRNVKVLWKPLPPWDRHSEAIDYVVTYLPRSEDGMMVQAERRTYVFNNQTTDSGETLPSELFQDDRTYVIRISANNSLGSTSRVTAMTVPKYLDTPNAPTDLSSVVLDDDTIQLSWQPTSPTRSETQLGGYIVFWREWIEVLSLYQWVEKGWAHVNSSQSTFDVTGLRVTKPTRFKFGVLVKTAGGFGTPVYISNYTKTDVPQGSVEDVEVNPTGPNILNVSWKPHALQWRNGLLQGYRIHYCLVSSCDGPCSETSEVIAQGEDTISHQLEGLMPYTWYRVQVEAFNTKGSSDLSDPQCKQTQQSAPSDAPTNLTFVIAQADLVNLSWVPPITPNGVITKHNAKINGELKELDVAEPPVTLTVFGDSSYNISVQACTISECGPLSAPVSFKTPIGAPGPPPIPTKQSARDSSIVLELSAPNHANGPVYQYVVFYQPQNSTVGPLNITVPADAQTAEVTIENCDGPVTYNFWVRAVNMDANGKRLVGEMSPVLEQEMCGAVPATGPSVSVTVIVIVAALVVTLLFVGILFKKNKDSLKKKLFPYVPGPVLPYYDVDEDMMDPYNTYSQLNFPTINYCYNNEKEQVDNIADFLNRGSERVQLVQSDANMNSTMPITDTVDKTEEKPVDQNSADDRRSSGYSTDPAVGEAEPADNSQPKGLDPQALQAQVSKESGGSIAPYTKLGENEEKPVVGQPSVSPEGIELAEMGAAAADDPPARSPESPIQDVADYLKTADGIMDYVRMGAGGDYDTKSGVDTPDYLQTYTLRNDMAKPVPEKVKPMDGYVRAATGKTGQFVEPDYQTRYSLESLPVTSGSSGYTADESNPSTTVEEPSSPESQLKNYISKSMPNILQGFPFAPATVAGISTLTPGKEAPNHAAENTTYIRTTGEINV
ncbi:tyrosine-protein phosphatase Lar-like isoform X3 [Branchiostoma floridae x Branchiostoma japonicum]